MNKKFYESKIFWVNLIAIAIVLYPNLNLSAETIAIILSVVNVILRFITKKEIVWK